jgi:hypothetical protein
MLGWRFVDVIVKVKPPFPVYAGRFTTKSAVCLSQACGLDECGNHHAGPDVAVLRICSFIVSQMRSG